MNIWHDINESEITPELFTAVIEIPKNSQCKYELDKETGLLKLDRELVDVDRFESFVKENGWTLMYVSAATGEGLSELIRYSSEILRELPEMTVYDAEYEPEDAYVGGGRETVITRENDKFIVEGEWLFNLMGQINFSDNESLNFFQRVLYRSGIFDELEKKGCKDGDTVAIYDFEFEFVK